MSGLWKCCRSCRSLFGIGIVLGFRAALQLVKLLAFQINSIGELLFLLPCCGSRLILEVADFFLQGLFLFGFVCLVKNNLFLQGFINMAEIGRAVRYINRCGVGRWGQDSHPVEQAARLVIL